jgi:hypothetical protein
MLSENLQNLINKIHEREKTVETKDGINYLKYNSGDYFPPEVLSEMKKWKTVEGKKKDEKKITKKRKKEIQEIKEIERKGEKKKEKKKEKKVEKKKEKKK